MKMSNYFFCTDFDATLIQRNSHEYLNELCSNEDFLRQIDEIYSNDRLWFERMNKFYEYLAEKENLSREKILRQFERIELIDGVEHLLKKFSSKNIFSSIISDGYDQIIRFVLKQNQIEKYFQKIISNPSKWIDNDRRLTILPYSNDRMRTCRNLCPFNLCKGEIVDEIRENLSKSKSIRLIYSADGKNDFCVCQHSKPNDLIFVRKNFPLEQILNSNQRNLVKGEIFFFENFSQIEQILTEMKIFL